MPNVLSPRDLVFRPDNMDETVQHMPMQYSVIFHGCKNGNFHMKNRDFFYFSSKHR